MSYTIEYNRKVYKEEATEENKNWETNYLVLIKQGDNNCYEANGQRVKSWDFISYGWNYSVIDEICRRAGACEGGCLKRAKGFRGTYNISPEDYLALYRDKIKKAKPITELLNDFRIEAMIYRQSKFNKTELKDMKYQIEKIDKAIKKYRKEYREGTDYYDENIKTFRKDIKDLKEFKEFLELPNWKYSRNCYCSLIFHEIKANQ